MNSLSGKTVLVTGGTGFIGTHVVKRLLSDKEVRIVILSRRPAPKMIENVAWVCSSLDRLSSEIWRKAGVDNIDLIIHLGAFTPKSWAEVDLIEDICRDNITGTRTLIESLPSIPKRIVFASTIDVYAPPLAGYMIDEASPLGDWGLYGVSKLFCERLIRVYARELGCGYAILRYGHIFGPGEGAYEKLIPKTIHNLLRGEPPVLNGNGNAERDYLYVDDAVEATLRAATATIEELGPVNIVRGTSTSLREIAEHLIKITGFSGSVKYLEDKPNGYSLRFNNAMMRSTLGEWDVVGLEEGLSREVNYLRRLSL